MSPKHTYSFTFVLDGPDVTDEEVFDALVEAGCDDALFGARDAVQYGDFDREAPTLASAVSSAFSEVESVPGMRVLRVEPDDLVTAAVIAERTGRSRESVRLLITGKRGPGGFPAPVAWIDAKSKVWQWSEVAEWFRDRLGEDVAGSEGASFIAALNAALELRSRAPRLESRDEKELVEKVLKEDSELLAV